MVYGDNKYDIKAFVNDKSCQKASREECIEKNKTFRDECTKCKLKLGRIILMSFFVMDALKIKNAGVMYNSAIKQRDLIRSFHCTLAYRLVDERYEKPLMRNLNTIDERCRYVFKILIENIKLTEYYPYFRAVGIDRLNRYALDVMKGEKNEDNTEMKNIFLKEIEEYNASHQEEISLYLESIRPTLEKREAERKKIEAIEEAEKEEERKKKKAAKEEEKLIKEYSKPTAAEKELNRTYWYHPKRKKKGT